MKAQYLQHTHWSTYIRMFFGPINPTSRESYRYIINFVDGYSSMLFVYFLRSKEETPSALKKFLADTAPIGTVKELHSDNGSVYTSEAFQKVLLDNGIKQNSTKPYTPSQNGKSERNWRGLMETARCLRAKADISKSFWPYAVRHAQYLRNRSFQRRTNATAYELFTRIKPDMRSVHPFGAPCVSYLEGHKQKLDIRGREGIYLGINPMNKGYYVLNLATGKVVTSRNVYIQQPTFDEIPVPEVILKPKHESQEDETVNKQPSTNNSTQKIEAESHQQDEKSSLSQNRSRRDIQPPKYLADYYLNTSVDYAYSLVLSIPQSYEEAISSEDADKWKAAMDFEIKTLTENHTWELIRLPESREKTKGRWVYALKQGKNPEEVKYKARYVARGFTQVHGLDYEETYSPTARLTPIRMLLQKATNEKLHLRQMDVKGAYLNASIDKDIYVQQPPGYEQTDGNGYKLTCNLRKSLYGLKQSGTNWNNTLTDFLKTKGLTLSKIDPCVYKKNVNNKQSSFFG
eukprot:gene17213-18934_t